MAKSKNPWLPYLGILGLLILWFAYSQFRGRKYEVQIDPIVPFAVDDVARFSIEKDGLRVTIEKKDSTWTFSLPDTGRPAEYKMNQFVTNFLKGEREGAVTADTAKYGDYGVSTDAMHVIIYANDGSSISFWLGASKTDSRSEFLRYDPDPNVYPARQRMMGRVQASADWWR